MADIVKKVYYKNCYSATRLRGIEQKSLFEDFEIQGWVIYFSCFILLSLGLTELLAYLFVGSFFVFKNVIEKFYPKIVQQPTGQALFDSWKLSPCISAGVTYFQYTYILSGTPLGHRLLILFDVLADNTRG